MRSFGIVVCCICFICLSLFGCGLRKASSPDPSTVAELDPEWRSKLEQYVKLQFNDEKDHSLRFRYCFEPVVCAAAPKNAIRGKQEGYCGIVFVNSRNSHKAYTGFKPYLYVMDGQDVAVFDEDLEAWSTSPLLDPYRCFKQEITGAGDYE